jgi:hypothetical protein
VEPLEVCISSARTFNPFNVVEIMSSIRFYIKGNTEVYLKGDADFDVKHGDIYITFDPEDMEELICKIEDLYAEVMYGSPDEQR